jgi:TatD DNase family protein
VVAELGLAVNVHSRAAGHHAIALLQELGVTAAVMHAFDGRAHYAEMGAKQVRSLTVKLNGDG